MKKKIINIAVIVLIIVSLIITAIKGLNIDLVYSEGVTVSITGDSEIKKEDAAEVASRVWTDNNFLIQKVEYFDDCIMVKVKEISEEQLELFVNKFNEKFNTEKTLADVTVEHVSNVKLSALIEPYIVPVGMSTLVILAYYAVRFKGSKQMISVIRNLILSEGIVYSIYAIGRIGINDITIPIALSVYVVTIAITTAIEESKKEK